MINDDEPRFVRLMEALGALYRIPLTPLMVQGYWETLDDIPIADLEWAAKEAARESEHFPKPATLRKIAKPDRRYKPGDGQITPMPDFTPLRDRPQLEGPEPVEDQLPAGQGIVAWRFETTPYEPVTMTPEQEAARKAELREQARLLKERGL